MYVQLFSRAWIVATLLVLGVPERAETVEPRSIRIFPEAVQSLVAAPGTVVIDVRPLESYQAGHIPGSVHWAPWDRSPDLELVTRQLGKLGIRGEETLVLYGDGDSYSFLAQVFWWLERAGCREVRVLEGGIRSWHQAGRNLEKTPGARPSVEFSGSPSTSPLADLQWVRRHFGTEGVEILDVRELSEGDLYRFPPLFRGGHIPHSLPYDFSRLLGRDGVWLADDESAREEFARLGPRASDPVRLDSVFALYGENPDDLRPQVGYLILRMLGVPVKVYSSGWEEWSSHPNPVVRIPGTQEIGTWLDRQPGLMVFDLRIRRDYEIGHLPGALSFPAYDPEDRFEDLLRGPDAPAKDDPLVFYCYGVDCIRSRNCSTRAAQWGFRNLYWFKEGYPGWKAAGLPVVTESTALDR